MAGYSKIYCIGPEGGFMGSDGINRLDLLILVGDGDRRWFEARIFNPEIRPLGEVEIIIPQGPDHPDSLLDALIAFFPSYFDDCPTMAQVRKEIEGVQRLDFDRGEGIPESWEQLRKEARKLVKNLPVYEAVLKKVE
jgi:hypothetical protein